MKAWPGNEQAMGFSLYEDYEAAVEHFREVWNKDISDKTLRDAITSCDECGRWSVLVVDDEDGAIVILLNDDGQLCVDCLGGQLE